jgi:hypothetical protein
MLFFDVGFNNCWQGIKNSCKYGCVLGVSYWKITVVLKLIEELQLKVYWGVTIVLKLLICFKGQH